MKANLGKRSIILFFFYLNEAQAELCKGLIVTSISMFGPILHGLCRCAISRPNLAFLGVLGKSFWDGLARGGQDGLFGFMYTPIRK